MTQILVIYSTTDGHTPRICERMRQVMTRQGQSVTVVPLAQADAQNLSSFDKIVIGASIRYGKHRPALVEFLQRNAQQLNGRPTAFFTVNLVARKAEKNRPDTNPYMLKLLRQLSWRPRQLAVFAGKVDYPRYGFFDRQIIRLIMWMTDGPTGNRDVIDYTDWTKVDEFAQAICRM